MKSSFVQIYALDIESIARQSLNSQLNTVLLLVDEVANPRFDRDRLCYGCDSWKSEGKRQALPRRPGAWCAANNCVGCAYGQLDQVRHRTPMEQAELAAEDQAEEEADLDQGADATLAADAKRDYKRKYEPIRLRDQNHRWCVCPACGGRGTVEEFCSTTTAGEAWKRVYRCRARQASSCKPVVEVMDAPPTDWIRSRTRELRPEQIRWTRGGFHQIDDQAGARRRLHQRYTSIRLVPGVFRALWIKCQYNAQELQRLLEPKPIEEE